LIPILLGWVVIVGIIGWGIFVAISKILDDHESAVATVQWTFLVLYLVAFSAGCFWMLVEARRSSAIYQKRFGPQQRRLRQKQVREARESNRLAQLNKPSFDHRLDQFVVANVHASEAHHESGRSPRFWQLRPIHEKTPAKPERWIRTILNRIRKTLHG